MFSLRNKKIIFELSSIPPHIWSSAFFKKLNPPEKEGENEISRVGYPENVHIHLHTTVFTWADKQQIYLSFNRSKIYDPIPDPVPPAIE